MAIEKMTAFTLYAPLGRKDALLPELQRFEGVHFKALEAEAGDAAFGRLEQSAEESAEIEDGLGRARFAAAKLAPYYDKPKGLKAMTTPPKTLGWDDFEKCPEESGWRDVCRAVLNLTERLAALKAERERITGENAALAPWLGLDASAEQIKGLRAARCAFGTVNATLADGLRAALAEGFPAAYIEEIGETREGKLIMAITRADEHEAALSLLKAKGLGVAVPSFSGVAREAVDNNKKRLAELEAERAAAEGELAAFAAHMTELRTVIDSLETRLERVRVCRNFLGSRSVLALEGWYPTRGQAAFHEIAAETCGADYYLEETDADGADVPVKLRNNAVVAPFEAVTAMYSLPKYGELDPTPVLTPFYMLFFAAMIGDAGFGLALLIGSSLALKFFHMKPGGRRFMRFFFCLSIPTILIGCLYGSLFGFTFLTPVPMEGGGWKAVIDTQLDIVAMIIISIALGTVQVVCGLGVKGYMLIKKGDFFAAFADSLLWIIAVLSGIGLVLAFAGVLPNAGAAFGWVMGLSLAGLAATQGRDAASLGGKIGTGLYAVYGITGYVGDLVSYTRLMALSLSGAYIGFSFIKISELFTGPLFWTFGVLIIVAGQALNLGLGALGAYVHTCRLQFVEFFGKFYEGGGVAFRPFAAKNVFVNVVK